MNDQLLEVDKNVQVISLKTNMVKIFMRPLNIAVCTILMLQIITFALFLYVFIQLATIQEKATPIISTLAHLNSTRITETLTFVEDSINFAKIEIYPQVKKLPFFINQTEIFIQKISSFLQNYFPQ